VVRETKKRKDGVDCYDGCEPRVMYGKQWWEIGRSWWQLGMAEMQREIPMTAEMDSTIQTASMAARKIGVYSHASSSTRLVMSSERSS
jgi:hypothetical protein